MNEQLITSKTDGAVGIRADDTYGISECISQDKSIKGKIDKVLSYVAYDDFTAHDELTKLDTGAANLSIDADGFLTGDVGAIPNYDNNSCYYVKLDVSIDCCGLNVVPPVLHTSSKPCRDSGSASKKIGSGCSS
ncbi:MAG: hypothetical protein OYH77_02955 [Pseudomonadota bacterium]|nr:hypothetical protein [Pseudomonadota bacterium]